MAHPARQHGLTTRQIAAMQGVSLDAVKYPLANVLGKLQMPDRKALRHWFRAPRGSALDSQQQQQARRTMTSHLIGPIDQIAPSVSDIKTRAAFYGEVLGRVHLYTFGPLAFFDCGGTHLHKSAAVGYRSDLILLGRGVDARASACP